MSDQPYRILSRDGRLSGDTYFLATQQPETLAADCFVVVNDRTGDRSTVHGTRLIPARPPQPIAPHVLPRAVCPICGKVEGVADDGVRCRHANDLLCALVASGE